MRILMISLDKNILDANSRVAERMRQYGQNDEIFIIIPATEKKSFDLSPSVHVFSTDGNKIAQFFRLRILGNKIIKEQKIGLITTQDPFFTGLVGWLLSKKSGLPWEVQVHGDFFGSNYYCRGIFKNRIKCFLSRFLIKRASGIRVVGERIKNSLLNMGIVAGKITVRPVFMDVDFIRSYQPRLNLHEKYSSYAKIFLVLSRLEPVKNISWLIDVFSQVIKTRSSYFLLIVGDGSERKELINKVKSLGLTKNIQFESWTGDPYSYLKTADCLLFPSLSEGYGLTVMEASAVDCPIIMTDVGVANYELKPEPKVKIVPVGDRDKFVQAILSV